MLHTVHQEVHPSMNSLAREAHRPPIIDRRSDDEDWPDENRYQKKSI